MMGEMEPANGGCLVRELGEEILTCAVNIDLSDGGRSKFDKI